MTLNLPAVKEALKAILTENGIFKPAPPPASQNTPPQMSDAAIELGFKELALKESQLQDKQNEWLLTEKQMHLEHQHFLKELELKHAAQSSYTII